jgi:hypothetical protein
METTGCQNREFILALLLEFSYDVAATVEYILAVGSDNTEFQHEYLAEKQQEKIFSKSPRYPSTASTTTTTTTNQMYPLQIDEEKSPVKEKKESVPPYKKKKDYVESEMMEKENVAKSKLDKFKNPKLTNRERKEINKKEKQTTERQPPPPPPVEVVDVSSVVQDLGSMQI